MRKLLSILFLMGLFQAPLAHANDEPSSFYAQLFAGPNFVQTRKCSGIRPHFHEGYIVSGALGYHWCYGLSLEAEYAFRRNTLSSLNYYEQSFRIPGHFQSSSYMANVLWDLPKYRLWSCFGRLRPFLGVGIGYDVQQIHAHQNDFSWRRDKKGFAWQLLAGISYPLACQTEIELLYKFHKGPLHRIYNHSLGIGISWSYKYGLRL